MITFYVKISCQNSEIKKIYLIQFYFHNKHEMILEQGHKMYHITSNKK